MPDTRRTYYDHEPAYKAIASAGGRGWQNVRSAGAPLEYASFDRFLDGELFRALAPRRALDVGCGGGQCSLRLARRGVTGVGIDFSETAVALAQRNAGDAGLAWDFRVGDVFDIGEIGPFDFAVDNDVLHCIIGPDRARFLASCARALRAGGLLFSETMSAEGEIDLAAYAVDSVTRINAVRNRFFVTEVELRDELGSAGFEVLSLERSSHNDSPPSGDLIVTVSKRR